MAYKITDMVWFCLLFVGFTVWEFREVQAVRCFECSHYPSPSLCTDVTTCTSDQDCYVEEVVTTGGLVVYNSGCITKDRCSVLTSMVGKRNTDITSCHVCCHGDLCNNEGCSKTAIPRYQRGPYCYSCDLVTKPDECDKLKICAKDEVCLLHIPEEFLTYPDPIYRAECQAKDSCAALPSRSGSCPPTCCDADFCNDHCANTTRTPISTTSDTRSTRTTISARTKPTSLQTTRQHTTTISVSATSKAIFTTTATSHGPKCRNHFYYVPSINFCVDIRPNNRRWADARHDCTKDHGDLLIYKTDQERTAITAHMRNRIPKQNENEYWIGLSDPQDNQVFFFVNGDKVVHTMWKNGQPDNDNENCGRASLSADMRWMDTNCDKTFPYICQTDPLW